MMELNEANFASETASGLVVVDFYTNWCGPCKTLTPILGYLTNAKVVKVDVEANENLGVEYNISSIPCIVFFKEGVEKARMVGLRSQEEMQKKIDELNGV